MRNILIIALSIICLTASGQYAQWGFNNSPADRFGLHTLSLFGGAQYTTTANKLVEGTHSANLTSAGGYFQADNIDFGSGGLTISFNGVFNTSGEATIIDTRVNETGKGMHMYGNNGNRTLYVYTNDGSTSQYIATASGAWSATENTKVWITLVIPEITGTIGRLYIDGVRSGTDSVFLGGWNEVCSFVIGGNSSGGSSYACIDKFTIRKRAITSGEVVLEYNNRAVTDYSLPQDNLTSYLPTQYRMKYDGIQYIPKYIGVIYDPKYSVPIAAPEGSLRTNFALDRNFILSGDASNGAVVGELMVSPNWDTITTIDYTLEPDGSGFFSITNDQLICNNVAGMTNSTVYIVDYKITDGDYYDIGTVRITKPPAADCYTVTDWSAYDNNFTTGKYYFQARGTDEVIAADLTFNVNNVYIGGIGTGTRPRILKGYSNPSDGGASHFFIDVSSRSDITIQNIEIRGNGYGDANLYTNFAAGGSNPSNLTIDNVVIDGYGPELNDYFSNSITIYGGSNIKLQFTKMQYTFMDQGYLTAINGFRAKGIISRKTGYCEEILPTTYPGGDGFQFGTSTGSYNVYFGHSLIDQTTHTSKHGVNIYGRQAGQVDNDTIEFCRFSGPGYEPTARYPSNGLSLMGTSNVIVRYCIFTGHCMNIFAYHDDGFLAATANNVTIFRCLLNGSDLTGIGKSLQGSGWKVCNTTIMNYGAHPGNYTPAGIGSGNEVLDVRNNIFYTTTGVNPLVGLHSSSTIDYNLYNDRGNHTLNTHEAEADPLFVGSGQFPNSLQSGSPAVNVGVSLTVPSLGFDLKFDVAPTETVDLGGYEYVP